MTRTVLFLIIGILILGAGTFYFLNRNGSYLDFFQTSEVVKKDVMEGMPREDELVKEVDEVTVNEMKGLLYQYSGELKDVTGRTKIRGVTTSKKTKGTAKSNYDGSQYLLLATFENLPEPKEDDFYEGWIVQSNPFMFISTGIVKKMEGVYTNGYKSGDDLTTYEKYVLTLEPNDGDPSPAGHILEGIMSME